MIGLPELEALAVVAFAGMSHHVVRDSPRAALVQLEQAVANRVLELQFKRDERLADLIADRVGKLFGG